MSYTMENGDALYARIAELEKKNEELEKHNLALSLRVVNNSPELQSFMKKGVSYLRSRGEIPPKGLELAKEWGFVDENTDNKDK